MPDTRTWRSRCNEIPLAVRRVLKDTYTDHGCVIWWEAPNSGLDGYSPKQNWVGYPADVLAAANRIEACSV